MQMIARVRVVVDVPFDFDVVELNNDPNVDNDPEVYESRESAADHATTVVAPAVEAVAKTVGVLVESLVEEVREAEVQS
jgi:hypothetical protein